MMSEDLNVVKSSVLLIPDNRISGSDFQISILLKTQRRHKDITASF
jgi:hypothetical protein